MRYVLTFAAVLMMGLPAAADSVSSALGRGDYTAALREVRPLAEAGDAWAQNILGTMYDMGYGVPRDYAEAMKWFHMSAEQGHTPAFYNIAEMYVNGHGVQQNFVTAYAIYDALAANGDAIAAHARDDLKRRMSPAQVSEAQRQTRDFIIRR